MTTITSENQISQSLLDTVNGSGNKEESAITATEDRFLTLLVEQMKNQDPLNPMENAQVTSQMAQLSTVTGIDKLNETMAQMISSVQSGQSYQAASMIGHNVLVEGNQINNTGSGGFFGVDLETSADAVNIDITNADGEVVKQIELNQLEPGVAAVQWDGIQDDGETAPAGAYTFTASATVSGNSAPAKALTFAAVQSVSTDSSGVKLNLSNDSSVATAEVKEIF